MTDLATPESHQPEAPESPEEIAKSRRGALIGLGIALLLAVLAVATGNVVYALGGLIFFVGLLVSVVLHEAGHFVTARMFGMRATQFFVGFGPTLWSRQRGETEYGVKAVPAGGFVKIVGMTPLEEVEPEHEGKEFFRFSVPKKTVVLAAGSTMHFIIALILVVGAVFALGTPKEQPPAVGNVAACIAPDPATVPTLEEARALPPICARRGAVPSPASASGLETGDVVLAVDGTPTTDSDGLTALLRPRTGQQVTLTVQRAGEQLQIPVTPAPNDRILSGEPGEPGERATVGTIGILVAAQFETEQPGSLAQGIDDTGGVLKQFAVGIKTTVTEKLGTVTQIYGDNRDPEGLIGILGAGRISGEVLDSDLIDLRDKALNMILIVASLNLFVGLFNLLPLLPLDGGHVAVAWFEGARDRIRRARGYRGAVKRVDYNKLLPVTYVVAGAFVLLTVFILGADLVNPVTLTS